MDTFNFLIAENLKKIREERKLSLDSLAKLSGVSKSMLGQIERGEVNPTVSIMWKIANGLKISFTQFISAAETDVEVVDVSQIVPLTEDEGKVKIYPMFSFDNTRRFEIYSLTIEGGGVLSAEPHLKGTQEFITVFSGQLSVRLDDKDFSVDAGNSIRFKADAPHRYKNALDSACRISMTIYYPV